MKWKATMDRIRPDTSTPLNAGEGRDFILNSRYDWIRTFPWLQWGIINIVTEEGVAQLHVTEETALQVHEASGIALVEMEWITDTDYNKYIEAQANNIDDSWLE